jgi:hypothetical protein
LIVLMWRFGYLSANNGGSAFSTNRFQDVRRRSVAQALLSYVSVSRHD